MRIVSWNWSQCSTNVPTPSRADWPWGGWTAVGLPSQGSICKGFRSITMVFSDKLDFPGVPFAHMAVNMGICHQPLPSRNHLSHKCSWTPDLLNFKNNEMILPRESFLLDPSFHDYLSDSFLSFPACTIADFYVIALQYEFGFVLFITVSLWLAQFLPHKYLLNK